MPWHNINITSAPNWVFTICQWKADHILSCYSVKVIIPCLCFLHPGTVKFRCKAVFTVTHLRICTMRQQVSERIKCHEIMHLCFSQSILFQNLIYLCLNITFYSKWNIVFTRMQGNSKTNPPKNTSTKGKCIYSNLRLRTKNEMCAKKKYFTINFIHSIHKVCQILSTFTKQCHCLHLLGLCFHLPHTHS